MGERFEPYSVRQMRKQQEGAPVVYQYDKIPKLLRAQIMYGLRLAGDAASHEREHRSFWATLEARVAAEHGLLYGLSRSGKETGEDAVASYVGSVSKMEYILDVIEIGLDLAYIVADQQSYKANRRKARETVDSAVSEINYRFGLHGVGYKYAGSPGGFIRVDTQYVHAEIVQPAILQLHAAGWKGPEDEFLSAHWHYRRGEYKAAMNDALKAFESTIKAILSERGCEFDPNWQAAKLVDQLIDSEIIPRPLTTYMHGFRSVLDSGVPTLRNRISGHGQGKDVSDVPDYVAAFTLNLTASNIVFLTEANLAATEKNKEK